MDEEEKKLHRTPENEKQLHRNNRNNLRSNRKIVHEDGGLGFSTIIKYGGVSVLLFSILAFLVTFVFTPELGFLGTTRKWGG